MNQPHPPHHNWLVEWSADGDDWAVAYPTHDRSKALARLARGRQETPEWQWRLVRETATYTVEDPATTDPVAQSPVGRATPSRRAGLRDEIVNVLGQIDTIPPVAHRREQADNVLALLYREWPWLRAEAQDAAVLPAPAEVDQLRTENERMRHELEVMYGGAFDTLKREPADRAVVWAEALREAADYAEATAEVLRGQHEFGRSTGALDVMTVLRRLAGEQPATKTEPRHTGGNSDDCPACITDGVDKLGYPWECPGTGEQPTQGEALYAPQSPAHAPGVPKPHAEAAERLTGAPCASTTPSKSDAATQTEGDK